MDQLQERIAQDEAVYSIAAPADLMQFPFIPEPGDDVLPEKSVSTLTAAQRSKMKRQEREPEIEARVPPKAQVLDPKFADDLREKQEAAFASDRQSKDQGRKSMVAKAKR